LLDTGQTYLFFKNFMSINVGVLRDL